MVILEKQIKQAAYDCGFDLAGIASLSRPSPHLNNLDTWLDSGYAADMDWIARQRDKRMDPGLVMDGAQSMLCVALIYNTDHPYSKDLPGQPWVSRYAWGDDYHQIMDRKLQALEKHLSELLPEGLKTRRYCDTGPVSEKTWAAAAGLGWIGKHSNLIHAKKGSWFFLGEILLNIPLTPDPPESDHCGSCTRCLDICPTDAFPRPYVVDSARCISYLSIEKRGELSEAQAAGLGANLYGCDLCQDVCPYNRQAPLTDLPEFQPRPHNFNPNLEAIEALDPQEFAAHYRGSAMKRTKLAGLQRNAAAVRKNLKEDQQ